MLLKCNNFVAGLNSFVADINCVIVHTAIIINAYINYVE